MYQPFDRALDFKEACRLITSFSFIMSRFGAKVALTETVAKQDTKALFRTRLNFSY